MLTLELELIKETHSKRITLVREIDKRTLYIKKELRNYNLELWNKLRQLHMKGIPHIYSLEEKDGWLEIIEEYIPSETLYEYLKDSLTHEEAFKIINQLCDILKVLHSQSPAIIHRDIKLENIFYDGTQVYLFDFDIARVYDEEQTRDTVYLGSKGYASPEQFGFLQTDERSDIYSLGVLYHVLLTGKFPRECHYQGYEASMINKMLAMDPQLRYQSIEEVQIKLKQLYQKHTFSKEDTTKLNYAIPGFRTRKLWKMIVATICYLLIAGIIILFHVDEPMTPYDDIIDRIMLIIMSMITIAFATNYLSLWSWVPGSHLQNRFLRTLSILICWLSIIFIVFIFFIIIFAILA